MNPVLGVLFVCTGNVCRSPYAERRAASLSRRHRFASAGTHALAGAPMDAHMAHEARVRGAHTDGFWSKQLTQYLADAADLILTAEAQQRRWILADWPRLSRRILTVGQFAALLPGEPTGWSPWEVVADVIERRGTSSSALDVPDPYRKGPEAARACADLLDGHLTRIFAHLG